ncbi:unnamed protein product [Vitrella brassicaformis CCMP3155]|uniref:Rieske domain-containing protein n=2 Tax=Vitrella brassicaformis TaxID=1169539 RepID=A0A0G4H8D8_VITBC|nr:unnamed protein product [Vitrella brassicaformis CCMP3155]|mmetsp:Transcript_44274/g.125233  ORF Transcript_44274/g.125233 Transcript_44274/m.125233 type:complete len:588 (-) Transcript_44274:385-2148(-)|eukprot:CEM40130.1 unnamed protein product [Vitrella brassicaformis CCMP3155]
MASVLLLSLTLPLSTWHADAAFVGHSSLFPIPSPRRLRLSRHTAAPLDDAVAAPDISASVAADAAVPTAASFPLIQEYSHVDEDLSAAEDRPPAAERYDWLRAWYPVLLSESADRGHAHAVRVLGSSFCVWHDGNAWRCYVDRCPHRLAPLSEGIVDKYQHTITCAYHGWAFGGPDGKCLDIPQAKNTNVKFATKNKRACAQAVPCQVAQGHVWIWLDISPEGLKASATTPLPIVDELELPSFQSTWNDGRHFMYMRDMPYGAEALLENLLDPAHVPVTHHNSITLQGTKVSRESAGPLDMALASNVSMTDGFVSAVLGGWSRALDSYTVTFRPPCRLEYRTQKGERTNYMICYCVPQEPGRSRLFMRAASSIPQKYDVIPHFVRHMWETYFLNQDMVFPHQQERNILNQMAAVGAASGQSPQEGVPYDRVCFLPSASDVPTRSLRRWLHKFSPPGIIPTYANTYPRLQASSALGSAERDRSLLQDVYESHTKHCPICMGAMRNIRRGKLASLALAFLTSTATFTSALLRRTGVGSIALMSLAALASASSYVGLRWVEGRFIMIDFHHQDNHRDVVEKGAPAKAKKK